MRGKETLFDRSDAAAEEQADARAEADVREGRLISRAAVRKWLQSWASGEPLPSPRRTS